MSEETGKLLRNDIVPKMQNMDDLKEFLKSLFSPKEAEIFLFGSRAKNKHNKFSDIDLGIYKKKNVDLKISLLREILENSNLPYRVDIVVLNGNKKFMDIVLREGIKWV